MCVWRGKAAEGAVWQVGAALAGTSLSRVLCDLPPQQARTQLAIGPPEILREDAGKSHATFGLPPDEGTWGDLHPPARRTYPASAGGVRASGGPQGRSCARQSWQRKPRQEDCMVCAEDSARNARSGIGRCGRAERAGRESGRGGRGVFEVREGWRGKVEDHHPGGVRRVVLVELGFSREQHT